MSKVLKAELAKPQVKKKMGKRKKKEKWEVLLGFNGINWFFFGFCEGHFCYFLRFNLATKMNIFCLR